MPQHLSEAGNHGFRVQQHHQPRPGGKLHHARHRQNAGRTQELVGKKSACLCHQKTKESSAVLSVMLSCYCSIKMAVWHIELVAPKIVYLRQNVRKLKFCQIRWQTYRRQAAVLGSRFHAIQISYIMNSTCAGTAVRISEDKVDVVKRIAITNTEVRIACSLLWKQKWLEAVVTTLSRLWCGRKLKILLGTKAHNR